MDDVYVSGAGTITDDGRYVWDGNPFPSAHFNKDADHYIHFDGDGTWDLSVFDGTTWGNDYHNTDATWDGITAYPPPTSGWAIDSGLSPAPTLGPPPVDHGAFFALL